MRKIIFVFFYLFSLSNFAADIEDRQTPNQKINSVLARFADLYDGLEEFNNIADCENELARRKQAIIETEIISHLRARRDRIKEENTLDVFGYEVSKGRVGKIAVGIAIPLIAHTAKEYLLRGGDRRNDPPAIGVYEQQQQDRRQLLDEERQADLRLDRLRDRIDLGVDLGRGVLDAYLSPDDQWAMIYALDDQIAKFHKALDNDSMMPIEHQVLEKVRELSSSMRERVVTLLLNLRGNLGDGAKAKKHLEHIKHCLTLPKSLKSIDQEVANGIFSLENGKIFNDDTPFVRYSKSTQRGIKEVIDKIIRNSNTDIGGDGLGGLAKPIFFFYGEPATGKSFAAKKIAEILGLPMQLYPISDGGDLKPNKVSGNDQYMEAKPGIFLQPFYRTDSAGRNYLNPVLIIDEIDILLEKKGHHTLDELVNLFDSDLRTMKFEYLGKDTEVDISNLIIIMTANSDLGESKKKHSREFSNAADKYHRLRDRMKMIHFDDFPMGEKGVLIADYCIRNELIVQENAELRAKELAQFLVTYRPRETIRQLFRMAESLALTEPERWKCELGIDDFVNLVGEEKSEAIALLISGNSMFKNICSQFFDDVPAHAQKVGAFVGKCFPSSSKDECKRYVVKLASIDESDFAKALDLSVEAVALGDLESIVRKGDLEETRDWLKSFFDDSQFLKYFCKKLSLDTNIGFNAIVDTLMENVLPQDLTTILRRAEICSEDAWPCEDGQEPERDDGHNEFLRKLDLV